MAHNSSQSATEDSLLQFERLEQNVNGLVGQRSLPYYPSIHELDSGSDQEEQSLQLPAHEPFMHQGIGGAAPGAEDGTDLPVELSYQKMLLSSHNNHNDTTNNERHTPVPPNHCSTPVQQQSSSSSLLSSLVSNNSREAPKTTPRPTTTTTSGTTAVASHSGGGSGIGIGSTTMASLMAPLKVPDFKQIANDRQQPKQQQQQRSPLQQLNVPNFRQSEIQPPNAAAQQHQKGGDDDGTFFGIGSGVQKGQRLPPMYQSTPHNKQRTVLKPTTPNGHQISPIPEESEFDDNHPESSDQRAVKSLITQLRDVIAQWDWAQARHRQVAKIYFERQNDELNAKWDQLNAEMAKFNETKADEWAQIAKVRTELRAEREKRLGKKEADRIIQLEKELAEFKAKDARASRLASELRTQNRELQGVVRVREQSYTDNIVRLKRLESQLVSAEQENSRLRTRLKLTRQEQTKMAHHQQQNQQQPQHRPKNHQQRPHQQQHQQQQQRTVSFSTAVPTVFTLSSSSSTTTTVPGTAAVRGEPTNNFHWDSSACGCVMASHGTAEKVQIDYLHAERLYEVLMPRGHSMRFLLNGHLELRWANGDRTLMFPDGERRELYSPEQPNFCIEIFTPSGIAYRLNTQTQWLREEFVPDPTRMSARADGSFVEKFAGEAAGLQINSPDFQLRRFAATNAVKLALERSAGIQLWLCPDNVLLVKHVFRQSGTASSSNSQGGRGAGGDTTGTTTGPMTNDDGDKPSSNSSAMMKKFLCFSLGQCQHIIT